MIEPRFINTEQRAVPKAVSSQQHTVVVHTNLPSKAKHVRKAHRLSPQNAINPTAAAHYYTTICQ